LVVTYGRRKTIMPRAFLLVVIAALAPQVAAAHVVRHSSIPEAYHGAWAPVETDCKDDKSVITLSARTYVGPAGSCTVDYVSETSGPSGAIYSARLQCPASGAQAQENTIVNLIFRSADAGRILVGPTFESLAAHRRCSASGPAAKQRQQSRV